MTQARRIGRSWCHKETGHRTGKGWRRDGGREIEGGREGGLAARRAKAPAGKGLCGPKCKDVSKHV